VTKYWTAHIVTGILILFLLGLHMAIMHMGGIVHLFSPHGGDAVSVENSLARDGSLFFTFTYILMLGVALYHGLYGLRTMLLELTLTPRMESVVTVVLAVVGLALFTIGSMATVAAHGMASVGGRV
jgi:succinate dehydrogenase / fumarate reductase membrane anchor subunit